MKSFTHRKEVRNNVQWDVCKTICLNLRTFVNPRYLCLCCAPDGSRKQRLEVKAYRKVMKEISIVNILKQLRVVGAMIKQEKTKADLERLKRTFELMAYSDLESDEDTA